MTVTPINGPAQVAQALADLIRDHGAAMPPQVWTELSRWGPWLQHAEDCAEALYAGAAALAPGDARDAAATVAAQLADMFTANQYHLLGQTDRGGKMSLACRRILGETVAQAPEDDPTPLAQYMAA